MTTQQQLILDTLTERLTAAGLTHTVDFDFANTGVIRTVNAELTAVAAVRFDFQQGSVHFRYVNSPDTLACHWYGQPRTATQTPAVKSNPAEVIEAVVDYLSSSVRSRNMSTNVRRNAPALSTSQPPATPSAVGFGRG